MKCLHNVKGFNFIPEAILVWLGEQNILIPVYHFAFTAIYIFLYIHIYIYIYIYLYYLCKYIFMNFYIYQHKI